MDNQYCGHNFMIFRTHFHLSDVDKNAELAFDYGGGDCTAVKTLNSSEVMYRRSVASSFMISESDEPESAKIDQERRRYLCVRPSRKLKMKLAGREIVFFIMCPITLLVRAWAL